MRIHNRYGLCRFVGYREFPEEKGEQTYAEFAPAARHDRVFVPASRVDSLQEPMPSAQAEKLFSQLCRILPELQGRHVDELSSIAFHGSLEQQVAVLTSLYSLGSSDRVVKEAIGRLEDAVFPELACLLNRSVSELKVERKAAYRKLAGTDSYPDEYESEDEPLTTLLGKNVALPASLTFLTDYSTYLGAFNCGGEILIGDIFCCESWWLADSPQPALCSISVEPGTWFVFHVNEENDEIQDTLLCVHETMSEAEFSSPQLHKGTCAVNGGCLGVVDQSKKNDVTLSRLLEQNEGADFGEAGFELGCFCYALGGDAGLHVYVEESNSKPRIWSI